MRKMKSSTMQQFEKEKQEAKLGPCTEESHKKKTYPCNLCTNAEICDNCCLRNSKKAYCSLCKMSLNEANWVDLNEEEEKEMSEFKMSPRERSSMLKKSVTFNEETGTISGVDDVIGDIMEYTESVD